MAQQAKPGGRSLFVRMEMLTESKLGGRMSHFPMETQRSHAGMPQDAKPGRQSEGLDLSFPLWKCPQTETKLWGAMHECPKRPGLGGRSRGPSSQTAKRGGQARGTWHVPRGTASPQLQLCEIITGRYDDILVSSPRPVHGRLGILSSSPGPLKLPYKYRNPPKQKQQP